MYGTYLHAFPSSHTRMPMKCSSADIGSRLNFERRSADGSWSMVEVHELTRCTSHGCAISVVRKQLCANVTEPTHLPTLS